MQKQTQKHMHTMHILLLVRLPQAKVGQAARANLGQHAQVAMAQLCRPNCSDHCPPSNADAPVSLPVRHRR